MSGDTATALKLFLKAYELKSNNFNYALSTANMHLTRGEYASAIVLYKELLRSKLTLKQQCMAERKIAEAWRGNAHDVARAWRHTCDAS